MGQSASPKLSSSLLRSRQTTSSIFPEAHEVTRSRIGTPASARATLAAVRPAHRVPASAWRTSMKMSTDVRGNCSLKTTELKASEMTFEISRSEEHTSELQSPCNLVCRLLLEKKKK